MYFRESALSDEENYKKMTCIDLRKLLRERNLLVSGRKAELIARLNAASIFSQAAARVKNKDEKTMEEVPHSTHNSTQMQQTHLHTHLLHNPPPDSTSAAKATENEEVQSLEVEKASLVIELKRVQVDPTHFIKNTG